MYKKRNICDLKKLGGKLKKVYCMIVRLITNILEIRDRAKDVFSLEESSVLRQVCCLCFTALITLEQNGPDAFLANLKTVSQLVDRMVELDSAGSPRSGLCLAKDLLDFLAGTVAKQVVEKPSKIEVESSLNDTFSCWRAYYNYE